MSLSENFSTATGGGLLTAFSHAGLSFSAVADATSGASGGLLFTAGKAVRNNAATNHAVSNVSTPSGSHTTTLGVNFLTASPANTNIGPTTHDDGTGNNFYQPRINISSGVPTLQIVRTGGGSGAIVGSSVALSSYTAGDALVLTIAEVPGSGNLALTATVTRGGTTLATVSYTDNSPLPSASTFLGFRGDFATTDSTGFAISSFADDTAGSQPTTGTFAGPTTGTAGSASTNFTVTLNLAAPTGGTAVALSDGGAGGTFTPSTLTIAAGQTAGTFTYSRPTAGASTLTPTAPGITFTPASITFTAASTAATATTLALSASSGYAGDPVTLTIGGNGTWTGTKAGTLSDGGAGGVFSPTTIAGLASGSTASITYTPPTSTSTVSITLTATLSGLAGASQGYSATADALTISPASLPLSTTTTVTFTGPAGLWPSAPPISASGLAGCSIGTVTRVNATTATAPVTTGPTAGTLSFADATTGATATATVAAITTYASLIDNIPGATAGAMRWQAFSCATNTAIGSRSNVGVVAVGASGSYATPNVTAPTGTPIYVVWDDGQSGVAGHDAIDPAPTPISPTSAGSILSQFNNALAATPVALAASQPNYAPATAAALTTLSTKVGTPAGASIAADLAALAIRWDGVCQGSASNSGTILTVTLDATQGIMPVGSTLYFNGGTGAGGIGYILAFNASTKVAQIQGCVFNTTTGAIVLTALTLPDSTTDYVIFPLSLVTIGPALSTLMTAIGTPAQSAQIPAAFTSALFASAGVFSTGALANAPSSGSVSLGSTAPAGWINAAALASNALAGQAVAPVTLAGSQPNYAPATSTALASGLSALATEIGTPAQASQIPAAFTAGLFASNGVFSTGALANAPSGGSGGASAAAIATQVWTELLTSSDFSTVGSAGAALKGSLTGSGAKVAADGLNAVPGVKGWSLPQAIRAGLAFLLLPRSGVPTSGTSGTVTYSDPVGSVAYGTVTVDTVGNITTNAMTPPA